MERFQQLGPQFGLSDGFEMIHYLIEEAFIDVIGGAREMNWNFLHHLEQLQSFDSSPIFSVLHEACYAQQSATRWSAQRLRADLPEIQRAVVRIDQEEPVPAPGDIARDGAEAIDVDIDCLEMSIRNDVLDRNLALRLERARHGADGGVEPVLACGDAAQVPEGLDHADGGVAAHAEVAGVVEIDHRGDRPGFHGRDQQAPTTTSEAGGSVTTADRYP